jgi:hypothetical protein
MRRRPAVTLLEVLIALFIMAIGMLALLVLFPLGAFSMGRALKDDRCATAASMAEQFAIANDLRHDTAIDGPLNSYTTQLFQTPSVTLPTSYSGPSFPVYVDPYGAMGGLTLLGTGPGIQRINPKYSNSLVALTDRWFSLPNDITFLSTGTPDLSSLNVDRGRRYTWSYMLRRPQAWADKAIDMTVVVYYNRPTAVPQAETVYNVSPTAYIAASPQLGAMAGTPTQGASGLVLTGASATDFRRGNWILDTTPIGTTVNAQGNLVPPPQPWVPRADFYRVVNVDDLGGGNVALDIQPSLICDSNSSGAVANVVLMSNVAEVFPKGTSWQP